MRTHLQCKGRGEPEGKDRSRREERESRADALKLESSPVNSIELDEMKLCNYQ